MSDDWREVEPGDLPEGYTVRYHEDAEILLTCKCGRELTGFANEPPVCPCGLSYRLDLRLLVREPEKEDAK